MFLLVCRNFLQLETLSPCLPYGGALGRSLLKESCHVTFLVGAGTFHKDGLLSCQGRETLGGIKIEVKTILSM